MPKPSISVGEIIDKSWHYYKNHFGELMSVSGWLLVAVAVNIIALAFYPSATAILAERSYTGGENFGTILLVINNFILTPLLGIWVTASLVRLIHHIVTGENTTLKAILEEGKKKTWSFLLVSVLFSLIVLAPILLLIPGFLFVLVGNGFSGIGASVSMIGTLLLIVGLVLAAVLSVLWGVRFFFSTYTLLIDGHKGRAALKKSHQLVHGNFWEVLIRLILPKALFFIVFAFGLFIANTIADVIVTGAAGLNIDLQVRLSTIVASVLLLLQTILINPIILIADYLIYKDISR